MEFKHACKICDRMFRSGKSMRGHMRSHFVKLPVQPKHASTHQPESPNAPKTITSAPCTDPPSGALNHSSGSTLGSQPQFASSASQFPATDLGIRVSARKRFKRNHPQTMMSAQPNAPLINSKHDEFSSLDILVTVEDAAYCLMMLANDKWPEGVPHPKVTIPSDSDDTQKDTIAFDSDEDDDVPSESKEQRVFEHRCETCKKVFNSYQALGGHKRHHKRPVIIPTIAVEKREFICNICLKVFPSGQALGGHKKVHLIEKKSTPGNPLSKKKLDVIEIDSDSEADSVFRFGSTSTSGTDETSSDTDAYYNAEW